MSPTRLSTHTTYGCTEVKCCAMPVAEMNYLVSLLFMNEWSRADLVMHFARIADSSPQKNMIGPYCILRKVCYAHIIIWHATRLLFVITGSSMPNSHWKNILPSRNYPRNYPLCKSIAPYCSEGPRLTVIVRKQVNYGVMTLPAFFIWMMTACVKYNWHYLIRCFQNKSRLT